MSLLLSDPLCPLGLLETIGWPLVCLTCVDGMISTIFSDLFVSQSVNGFNRKHSNPVHHMFIDISSEF